jgi:RNA polymerase sigma-70 factor (ECF subfamily)
VAEDLRSGLAALLPRLRRFGIALTGSAADADELVQDACERALVRFAQLRDVARLDSWVYGIMRHLWVDEMRWRRVRRHDDLETALKVVGEDGEASASGRITLLKVRQCLDQLPADQRAVMTLVCVDGLTYREAAAILDIPIGTVMSRLSRGRAELHARLAVTAEKVVAISSMQTTRRST